jgi:hypothetical protein
MKAILVATIGTRDLMFQISSGSWYNVGDDRMQDGDIIGEQLEVLSDLSLGTMSYRALTQYLLDRFDQYQERLRPVILGRLLNERANEIEKVYLVGTDQAETVKEREKDTLYACELIEQWLLRQHQIPTEIILLGRDGINPSNFEQMFRWWQRAWRESIAVRPEQPIWLCLKGGVGQASEASRISGLSRYGDRIQFFEFKQNRSANYKGIPSDYEGPFLGTNYLWDRTQQQALQLLDRYDYAGVNDLLQSYFKQDSSGFGATPTLIKAGIAWQQGQFDTFYKLAKSVLTPAERRRVPQEQGFHWWKAYEQAFIGAIRLEQGNTVEAMLHSFRAVEGLMTDWIHHKFYNYLQTAPDKQSLLCDSISSEYPLSQYPELAQCFVDIKTQKQVSSTPLLWRVQRCLLEIAIPSTANNPDYRAFWSKENRDQRNLLSHRLGGLSRKDLFNAWGRDIKTDEQWSNRILSCLNQITGQSFKSLSQASLFTSIHTKVVETIAHYQP